MPPPSRPGRRFIAAAAIAWLLITTFATILHWWVWIVAPGADGSPSPVEGSWPKEISGALMMLALPGWALVSKVFRTPATQFVPLAAACYAVGFGLWAVGILCVARIRAGVQARFLSLPAAPAPRIDLSRRRMLIDAPFALAGVGSAASLSASTLIEPWSLRLRSYTVPIADLPAPLNGLRIIQLSDTHLGPRVPAWHIRRAVQLAVDARPDVIVLTGDYIHNGARYISHAAHLFKPIIAAGIPCAGVLGNHDWFGDGPGVRAALSAIGIRMVDNSRVYFGPDRRFSQGPVPDAICIAGVGDLLEDAVDLDAAVGGVPGERPRILLSHNPDVAESLGNSRIDLMLSGHTHGGQVRLPFLGTPWVPSRFGSKYAGGLVRGPSCPVIISRGIGLSIMPVRFGVPPEVVEAVLRRA